MQSVLNATARLVFSARKTEHMSPLLQELHWLKVPERIKFRLCVLTYRCLHGTAPSYLAETIRPVSGLATRRHLRSADTSTLLVPTTRRSTLGDRAFPAAAARDWNLLPKALLPCSPSAANSRLYCLGCRTLSIDSFSTVS